MDDLPAPHPPQRNIEDFNLLTAKWFAAYDVPNQLVEGMIGKAAEEEWFLLRYQRSFNKTCEILLQKSNSSCTTAANNASKTKPLNRRNNSP